MSNGELNVQNPLKEENTIGITYKTSGSVSTNPTSGELIWDYGTRVIGSTTKTFVQEIYINEEDQSNTNSGVAISNLKPGDKITFELSYTIDIP